MARPVNGESSVEQNATNLADKACYLHDAFDRDRDPVLRSIHL